MPETSFRAAISGLALLPLLAQSPAHADETPCPSSVDESQVRPAAAPAAPRPDPASTSTEISGDKVEYNLHGHAVLSGNVLMQQGDRRIRADYLEYDAERQQALVKGGVEYSDPTIVLRGNSGSYSAALGADFEGTQFELPSRGARGAARNLKVDGNGKVTLAGVSFTTCPADDVSWQIEAKSIELDTRAQEGTGRGTRVEFKGVPILYAPWFSFPISDQRKSGFLFPNMGGSSRNGAELELPYYWNVRPNLDFTATPTYYSKRGVDLGGELRYLTRRQRGTFEFNYLPSDDLADRDRTRLALTHLAELPGEWRFRVDATDVSDTSYFEDFEKGPEGTSIAFAERLAELSYRDEHLNLRAQVQDFQTIDEELADDDRPYTRAPRLLASGDWGRGGALEYGFEAELVDFERDTGVTGWRFDAAPHFGLDWSAPGFFVRPSVGYRYTQYALDGQEPGLDDSPSRALPIATLDAGLVFERPSGSHGQRRLTLEPRALYLYTPFREQDDLPVFDTGLPDLNLVQLFRTNRFVGADRVNDANQVAFGLTSRLLDSANGTQYLALSLGEAYYFETPRVVLPDEPVQARDTSDFIAQVSLTAYKNWNIEAGMQWDPENSNTERSQVRVQYRPNGEHVVNLGYRFQSQRIEQAELSGAWSLGRRWNAFGRFVYSLLDDKSLDQFAGFEYKACCFKIRGVARRSISNRDGSSESSFYVQLELNGLASVGTSADAFLERTIRGYSRETTPPGKVTP
ncbi:MAG TPA: LPS assembly protein LptD [Steroidobacteraceae bacterium]|nr:LPS assembly protein LptD [Steroidobacteraceae bacterium]